MNRKIKDIIQGLEFMSKTGSVSKTALDIIRTGLEELDEELKINN